MDQPDKRLSLDFFPYLFNKSGKKPKRGIGLKDDFEETSLKLVGTRKMFFLGKKNDNPNGDGVEIGLSATPAAHTKAFFKEIVYSYDYERAVRECYLVDYDAIAIQSNITLPGVFFKEGEEVGLVNTQTGQLKFETLEDERELPAPTTEIDWTAPDRNRKIVQEIKKYLLEQENQFGHFPKTLIFAQNDIEHISHCDQLVEVLRREFNRGDDFVQKITGSPSVDRPLQKIRELRNRQNPGIVVTVDMLSTGVDVPRIENIVFLRPVQSRILSKRR